MAASPVGRTPSLFVRSVLAVLALVGVPAMVLVSMPGTAFAADGFRYWNYFHLENGRWAFATAGAGDYQPRDGAVEGYRYGVSATAEGIPPRADLDTVTFDSVCGQEQKAAGQKRVAVVIDYGTATDAGGSPVPQPRAECAVVAKDATGQQALAAVADIRSEQGLTCALDGYPEAGCGEPVPDAKPVTDEPAVAFVLPASADASADQDGETEASGDEGSSSVPWLVGVGAVIVALGVAASVLARRNRTS